MEVAGNFRIMLENVEIKCIVWQRNYFTQLKSTLYAYFYTFYL